MTTRVELINWLIESRGYTSYLEIGVKFGNTFNRIKAEHKVGVDILDVTTHTMTSDYYFANHAEKFDLIFIDGLHKAEQVERDILNALVWLSPGGTIVCHDVNPPDEIRLGETWCWSAWEAWAKLRATRSDLWMGALEFDYLGVITRGQQKRYPRRVTYSWEYLDKHRDELLNVITEEELRRHFTT